MTSYAQMSVEEFQKVLDECNSARDVSKIQQALINESAAIPPLWHHAHLSRPTTIRQSKAQYAAKQKQLAHIETLSGMAVKRVTVLFREGKY